MANVEDFTGAVNISGDLTPITRQKVEQVTPEKWPQMTIGALWDQRLVLSNRIVQAQQCGHAEMINQIQQGINMLDAVLAYKAKEAEESAKNSGLIR